MTLTEQFRDFIEKDEAMKKSKERSEYFLRTIRTSAEKDLGNVMIIHEVDGKIDLTDVNLSWHKEIAEYSDLLNLEREKYARLLKLNVEAFNGRVK